MFRRPAVHKQLGKSFSAALTTVALLLLSHGHWGRRFAASPKSSETSKRFRFAEILFASLGLSLVGCQSVAARATNEDLPM